MYVCLRRMTSTDEFINNRYMYVRKEAAYINHALVCTRRHLSERCNIGLYVIYIYCIWVKANMERRALKIPGSAMVTRSAVFPYEAQFFNFYKNCICILYVFIFVRCSSYAIASFMRINGLGFEYYMSLMSNCCFLEFILCL